MQDPRLEAEFPISAGGRSLIEQPYSKATQRAFGRSLRCGHNSSKYVQQSYCVFNRMFSLSHVVSSWNQFSKRVTANVFSTFDRLLLLQLSKLKWLKFHFTPKLGEWCSWARGYASKLWNTCMDLKEEERLSKESCFSTTSGGLGSLNQLEQVKIHSGAVLLPHRITSNCNIWNIHK